MHVAAAIALFALLIVVGALVWLHLRPTGLSPLRNAVSQYGISDYRVGYRVATIAFAISGAALAIAISRATHGNAGPTVALLIAFAVARALISWFPMDAPGGERTGTGAMHGVLAIVAFAGVALAALKLGHVAVKGTALHGLASTSTALGILMTALLVGMGFSRNTPALRARFGLIERGFYLAAIVWCAVFSIACLR
jgi:hypothetical protein